MDKTVLWPEQQPVALTTYGLACVLDEEMELFNLDLIHRSPAPDHLTDFIVENSQKKRLTQPWVSLFKLSVLAED